MSRFCYYSVFFILCIANAAWAAEPCDNSYVPPGAICSINSINFHNDLSGSVRWTPSGNFINVFSYDYRGGKCKPESKLNFYSVHSPKNFSADITVQILDLIQNNKAGFKVHRIHTIPCINGQW